MNCQSFENMIGDLARGGLMDAAQREQARAHKSECARCAARLADERALGEGLRALGVEDQRTEAPPRVEAALLAAFRQQHASAQSPSPAFASAPSAGNVRSIAASRWWASRWAQGAAVAAASMLLVFGLYGALRDSSSDNAGQLAKQSAANSSDKSAKTDANAAQTGDSGKPDESAVIYNPDNEVEGGNDERREQDVPDFVQQRTSQRAPRYQLASNRNGRVRTTPAHLNTAEQEITTDYIPLAGAAELTPGDAGHVMRVEVPRSALASFGLPVDADRADARVKADVLIGEDGIARAIRFVR